MTELDYYFELLKRPSTFTVDICEHLETLRKLALECDHVTEMGFRTGTSFTAFLAARPKKLVTYDLVIPSECRQYFERLKGETEILMFETSTLNVEIEETDLLFIDTLHTYLQLKKELELHGNKARKYLTFHDTVSYGEKSEDGTQPGLCQAIEEFIIQNPHWQVHEIFHHNNGLTILKREIK